MIIINHKSDEKKNYNPKFCDSKICPEGVARQNPTRILSALQGNPGFFTALICAIAKFGIPRKIVQILVEFGRAVPCNSKDCGDFIPEISERFLGTTSLSLVADFAIAKSGIIIIIILSLMIFPSIGLAATQTDLDFEIPTPPKSELLNTLPLRLGGRQILTASYTSKESQYTIKEYYQRFFKDQGFNQLFDKQLPQTEIQQIRFKRKDLVIDVVITPKPGGAAVAVAKYLQPEGTPDLEKSRLSVKDSFMSLPKDDLEGKDLRIIPRPPESVRLSNLEQGNYTFLSYITPLSVEETRDFYKLNMPYQAWELEKEVATGDVLNDYKKATGKKQLGLKSPFIDGENLDRIIADGYLLDFKGRFGQARITIFPNFVDRKLGSMVQIVYNSGEKL